jgi:prevent-host-death family protein
VKVRPEMPIELSMTKRRKRAIGTVSATEFKNRSLALLREVHQLRETVLITKRGKPVARLTLPGGPRSSLADSKASLRSWATLRHRSRRRRIGSTTDTTRPGAPAPHRGESWSTSVVILQPQMRDQFLALQMPQRILQLHQLNKQIMLGIKPRRRHRRFKVKA